MAKLCPLTSFCCIVILQLFPISNYSYAKQDAEQPGDMRYLNGYDPRHQLKGSEDNYLEQAFRRCDCKGGHCGKNETTGEEICICPHGYGWYNKKSLFFEENYCRKCECGQNVSCTFSASRNSDNKACICPLGYGDKDGICADCDCGGPFYSCTFKKKLFGGYEKKCIEIEPCSTKPCRNGGTCAKIKAAKGLEGFDYNCSCPEAYSGRNCETPKDDCVYLLCRKSHEVCRRFGSLGGNEVCICKEGYYRHSNGNCVEIDPCLPSPCQNAGTCIKREGLKYICQCPDAYQGTNCEIEINPCSSLPCENGGTCIKGKGLEYTCKCPEAYNGANCENEINPCKPSPCKNDGICSVYKGNYKCTCTSGFYGSNCEKFAKKDFNSCENDACKNGGKCYSGRESEYICVCPSTHTGRNCEIETNGTCYLNPCKNGGTCSDTKDGYVCSCMKWFTGKNCTEEKFCLIVWGK